MQTHINLFKQNNDHTRKMREVIFGSSFNLNVVRKSQQAKSSKIVFIN